ncbi:hypothetical protein QJS10_CPB17g01956 [Acorus calamus]|uniref:Uncharacterized protein n=1 Tax=Acorus calamus TaxID=4465 RepID=A0AAV9CTT6_ACOCL|nr:hypothetical protein QJS10_CPB17g01956 [Acorus calamus]
MELSIDAPIDSIIDRNQGPSMIKKILPPVVETSLQEESPGGSRSDQMVEIVEVPKEVLKIQQHEVMLRQQIEVARAKLKLFIRAFLDHGPEPGILVAGANAVLFLVSKSIPWDLQRNQLHMLIESLLPDSSLPLLILACDTLGDAVRDSSLKIIDRLNVDREKISSFRVVIFLNWDAPLQHLNGFLMDECLREGLQ